MVELDSKWISDFLNKHKYVVAFVSAFLLDVWFDMCAYAANHSNYPLGIFANLTYPMISMIPILLVVEEKNFFNRLKIATVEGCGYAVGITLFMLARDHFRFN